MKRLQIVDHNIDIGHCKVKSRDFVTYIYGSSLAELGIYTTTNQHGLKVP